jgi:hypothetical protein
MCHPRATAAVIVTEVELPGIVRGGIIRGPGGRHRVAELREGAAAGRRREADLGENGASAATTVTSRRRHAFPGTGDDGRRLAHLGRRRALEEGSPNSDVSSGGAHAREETGLHEGLGTRKGGAALCALR